MTARSISSPGENGQAVNGPARPVPEAHRELLAQIAELYYDGGQTQTQIAALLRYSRSMISRYLTEARELGIVEIRINHPVQRRLDLEAALKSAFGLTTVRVLTHTSNSYPSILRRLGGLAADVVEETVKDGDIVGITWGVSLAETVAAMRPTGRQNVWVAQMIGSLGARNPDNDGPELARKLARALGAEYKTLPAPLFVDSIQARDLFIKDRRVSEVLGMAKKMRVLLVGIGTIDLEYSSLFREAFISREQTSQLVKLGAVGDIAARHFDRDGKLLNTVLGKHTIGIEEAAMRNIPVRIGIAGGSAKAVAVLGALRGKLINVLVTDEIAATAALSAR